jgi:outer membrane biosynthesis protein TonB
MLRSTLAVIALLALAHGTAQADKLPHQLTGAEIGAVTSKSLGDIRACYQPHALRDKNATGKVEVKLIIHRDGTPFRVEIDTPGVSSKKLDRCVNAVARSWRFPMRRGFTHSVVPYFFLRTHAAGAGPQHSCWKASGCKTGPSKPAPSPRDEGPRLSKKAD